ASTDALLDGGVLEEQVVVLVGGEEEAAVAAGRARDGDGGAAGRADGARGVDLDTGERDTAGGSRRIGDSVGATGRDTGGATRVGDRAARDRPGIGHARVRRHRGGVAGRARVHRTGGADEGSGGRRDGRDR